MPMQRREREHLERRAGRVGALERRVIRAQRIGGDCQDLAGRRSDRDHRHVRTCRLRQRLLSGALDLRVDAGAHRGSWPSSEAGKQLDRGAARVFDVDVHTRDARQRALLAGLQTGLAHDRRGVVGSAERLELLGRDRS